jgi:2'-5' RNA ligase superfamily
MSIIRCAAMAAGDSVDAATAAPQKHHHFTVCLALPHYGADEPWELLTRARTLLRDPGLFRWPPHANLLYPFVDPFIHVEGDRCINLEIIASLMSACQSCEPFSVRLQQFGTFGGSHRGVLWLYPESYRRDEKNEVEPLIQLQARLEEEFPHCHDQSKQGLFHPHATLSHFPTLAAAQQGAELVKAQTWWPAPCAEHHSLDFVGHIYLLYRDGDQGQFHRVADLGLGREGVATIHTCTGPVVWKLDDGPVQLSARPLRFPLMPQIELDWVREERLAMKMRRNGRNGRRGRSRDINRVPDSPETVAAKRAARQAKRDALAEANS